MKKLLLLISVLLVGCGSAPVAEVEDQDFEVVVVEAPVIEIEDEPEVSQGDLKALLRVTNSRMRVVEIEVLHERMAASFESALDRELSIEDQRDIVDEIVQEAVRTWRQEQVLEVLSDHQVTLNQEDLDWLIHQTSMDDMYRLMLSYEMVYLKNNLD